MIPDGLSQSGDSGGLVYTLDDGDRCRALGFVIGGNDDYTLVTPASKCLAAMEASLYAPH
jgi:hypothetical protein